MNSPKLPNLKFSYFMILFCACSAQGYETISLLDGWRFYPGEQAENPLAIAQDTGGESVTIPHDWSISMNTNPDAASSGGGGFYPTGTAWYTREIEIPEAWRDQRVYAHFEGIYRHSQIWINGVKVAGRANGYLPVRADLTPHLEFGKSNHLAVRVDNSRQPNSRWYTGSGIYRPARLEVRHPVHLVHDGVHIQTSNLYGDAATMGIRAEVRNDTAVSAPVTVDMTLVSPEGLPLLTHSLSQQIQPANNKAFSLQLPIAHPRLWSPESPTLYRVIVRTYSNDLMTDRQDRTFGIRTLEATAEEGFLLNENSVLLVGCNLHHDHGPLGAAAYPDAEERKVRLLKKAGFNAVRTAHNPPSPAFLEACDRLGMLVIDEAFDGWKVSKVSEDYGRDFDNYWEQDLRDFIRRDRNHPSVIMWSIGNEMYERGKSSSVELAAKMVDLIKEQDRTRPVTAGVNGLGKNGNWEDLDDLFAKLDVVGYNYELERQHATDHERVPERVIYASESYVTDVFTNWKLTTSQPYILGDFVWSGMDYLGEAGIGRIFSPDEEKMMHWEGNHYPWHGAACGELDICGSQKPVSHYRNIVWNRGEHLHLSVREPGDWNPTIWAPPSLRDSWTWPGHEGEDIDVVIYSRYPTVRLFLDRTLMGVREVSAETEFKAVFKVPYRPGRLLAQGMRGEEVLEETQIETAGKPRMIHLSTDRQTIQPNGLELAFIEVTITDAGGRLRPDAEVPVLFSIEGPGEILTTGNADLSSTEPYGSNPHRTHHGKALVIIRSLNEKGDILLHAQAEGLIDGTVSIRSAWSE